MQGDLLSLCASYHNVNSLAQHTLSDPLVDGDILPDTDPYSTLLRFFEFSDASWEGETLRAVSAYVAGQCMIPPRSRPPSYVSPGDEEIKDEKSPVRNDTLKKIQNLMPKS